MLASTSLRTYSTVGWPGIALGLVLRVRAPLSADVTQRGALSNWERVGAAADALGAAERIEHRTHAPEPALLDATLQRVRVGAAWISFAESMGSTNRSAM